MAIFMAILIAGAVIIGNEIVTMAALSFCGVVAVGWLIRTLADADDNGFVKGQSGIVNIDEWGRR